MLSGHMRAWLSRAVATGACIHGSIASMLRLHGDMRERKLSSLGPANPGGFALFAAVALAVLGAAQAAGWWINGNIPLYASIEWNGLVHLTHIRNHGGIFGLLQGHGWLFGLFSLALLGGISIWLYCGARISRLEFACFGCIAGGGLSNVLDRIVHGSVIDYIDLQQIPWWNYVFNLADVMIHIGIWPMIVYGLFAARPGAPPQE